MEFTVFLTTIGRPVLKQQLESIVEQLLPTDRLYIAIDGIQYHDSFNKIYEEFKNKFKCKVYIIYEKDNLGYWGHGLRNKYQKQLEGDYILHADDDNFYTCDAFKYIRAAVNQKNKLYIFQVSFKNSNTPLGPTIQYKYIDTGSGIVANIPEKMGRWENIFGGDYFFYKSTSELFGKENIIYVPELIYILCPNSIEPAAEDLYYTNKTIELTSYGAFVGIEADCEHCFDHCLAN